MDIGIRFQGQEIDFPNDNIFRFLHHLGFGNPESRFCHGDGKIIDFNAVELFDGHFDRVIQVKESLTAGEFPDDPVLQPTQADECFRQKISGAAGRVQEGERSQFILEIFQFLPVFPFQGRFFSSCAEFFGIGNGNQGIEFFLQVVQKEGVDDFVDIFDGGVVHAAGTPGFRIQCAFKDGSKDGGTDGTPVEALGHIFIDNVIDFLIDRRDFNGIIMKQAAIHIGEGRKFTVQKPGALFYFGIKNGKELFQRFLGIFYLPCTKVVAESVRRTEQS